MSDNKEKRILLLGNPNVGKSAIFSRLTGARVTISNYPGTTVGFSQGYIKLDGKDPGIVIDVPGIYNLEALCKADDVAIKMLEKGDVVINVVDATNLERNLFLTLELREKNMPTIVALNMWDETRHKGIEIDTQKLEKELGIPVVPVCGLTGFGIKHLMERMRGLKKVKFNELTRDEKWEEIGKIVNIAQTLHHHHHTILERFEDMSTRPLTGLPIALFAIYVSFLSIRFISEGLITHIVTPLFTKLWLPLMLKLSVFLAKNGFLHDMLIGKLINGNIDFGRSFGLFTTGLFVPIGAVLPYVLSFYIILGLLEDLGYLPRLATQVDNLMHRMGLHGYAIIPMVLGLGCNVPGMVALRLLENRREKFIAATLMAIAVPCMAQTAMIIGLVGERGGRFVTLIFGILLTVFILKGLLMNRLIPGRSPEILWEIPPYRLPHPMAVIKKLKMRISEFICEAVPFVLAGVFLVNIMYLFGVFDFFSSVASPVLSGLWGLPKETISALLMGFFRKDLAVGMLGPLALTTKELIITCTILTLYFPCMATFAVMVRELGIRDMIKSLGIMLTTTTIVGILLNIFL